MTKKSHERSQSEPIDLLVSENSQCAGSSHQRTNKSVLTSLKSLVPGKQNGTPSPKSPQTLRLAKPKRLDQKSASESESQSIEERSQGSSSVFRHISKMKKRIAKTEERVEEWLTPETLNSFDEVDKNVLVGATELNKAMDNLNREDKLSLESSSNPSEAFSRYIFEMRDDPLNQALQVKGCKKVGNLAAMKGLSTEMSNHVVNAIVCAMRTFPSKEDVQTAACQALRRCSAKVEHFGNQNNPQLPEGPVSTSKNILLNREACKIILSGGVLHSVLKAMQLHKNCRDLQREGIRVLRHSMSFDSVTVKQTISDLEGIEIIIAAMWSFNDSSVVQEDGCILVWSLAFDDLVNQSRILQNNGVGAILCAIASYSDSEAVQRFATGALHALSSDEDTCIYILDNGGVQTIMKTLEKFRDNQDIMEKSLATIANVAVCNEDSRIFKDDDIQVLLQVYQIHSRVESIRKIGCFLLESAKREHGKLERNNSVIQSILNEATTEALREKKLLDKQSSK